MATRVFPPRCPNTRDLTLHACDPAEDRADQRVCLFGRGGCRGDPRADHDGHLSGCVCRYGYLFGPGGHPCSSDCANRSANRDASHACLIERHAYPVAGQLCRGADRAGPGDDRGGHFVSLALQRALIQKPQTILKKVNVVACRLASISGPCFWPLRYENRGSPRKLLKSVGTLNHLDNNSNGRS